MKSSILIFILSLLLIGNVAYSETAKDIKKKADLKLQIRDYKGAVEMYSKLIDIDPEFEDVYLMRGKAKIGLGKCISALQDVNIALQLDPKSASAYAIRARIYLLGGDCDNLTEAYQSALKAISLDSNNIDANLYLGASLSVIGGDSKDMGNLKQSLNYLTKVININPKVAEAYFLRASTLFHISRQVNDDMKVQCKKQFRSDVYKTIELDPNEFGKTAQQLIVMTVRYWNSIVEN